MTTMKEPKVPHLQYGRIEATDEFIEKNKFVLKTQDEIYQRLKKTSSGFMAMDFRPEVLINHLNYDLAKEFLNDEYKEKVDKGEIKSEYVSDIKEIVQDFLDYMVFAWGKAEDERGISAGRSLQKLGAWLWLLNREDLETIINDDDLYNPYGSPALIEVCNQLGVEVPSSLVEFSKVKC